MSNALFDVLSQNKDHLLAGVLLKLKSSSAQHYQHLDEQVLQARVRHLVESFLLSIEQQPSVFIDYIRSIAKERISEGFFLHEMQTALQILEEMVWKLVADSVLPDQQIRSLGIVTGIIGAAKDQLAHNYLRHLELTEQKVVLLQQRLNELSPETLSSLIEHDELGFGIDN